MPVTIPTLAQIQQQVIGFFQNRWPGKDTSTESWIGKEARAWAMSLLGFYNSVQSVDNDACPTTKTSTAGLDRWAQAIGLPDGSGVAGNFGRKIANAASGGGGLVGGTNGVTVPDGTQLLGPDGQTVFKLSGAVTIPGTPPGSGTIAGVFVAVTPGAVGNLPIGSVLTWQSPPPGINPTVTLTTALSGGFDSESNSALLARILYRLQYPPKGGTAADYRGWAESRPGVARAYVYPRKYGPGSVAVLITQGGAGRGRIVTTAVHSDVDSYIKGSTQPLFVRKYATLDPYMPSTAGLGIRVRIVANQSARTPYAFDWASADPVNGLPGYAYPITAYTPGTYPTLTISSTGAPATLLAAVAAYAASPSTVPPPYIQVASLNANCATFVDAGGVSRASQMVAVTTTVLGGPNLTLTLGDAAHPLPAGYVDPQVGDTIYPGAAWIPSLIQPVLDYINGLGPSRQSGYGNPFEPLLPEMTADPFDPWEDTASIARIVQTVMNTVDVNGNRFAGNIVNTAAGVHGVYLATVSNLSNAGQIDIAPGDYEYLGVQMHWAANVIVSD